MNIPNSIVSKWKSNVISDTHFSDIIRTELLIKYGGTWIDSTVYVNNKCEWFEKKNK